MKISSTILFYSLPDQKLIGFRKLIHVIERSFEEKKIIVFANECLRKFQTHTLLRSAEGTANVNQGGHTKLKRFVHVYTHNSKAFSSSRRFDKFSTTSQIHYRVLAGVIHYFYSVRKFGFHTLVVTPMCSLPQQLLTEICSDLADLIFDCRETLE